jgi:hypothetical protein
MTRRTKLGLLLLVALTAGVRLPGVTRPLLGNFATKNVVYAMSARNWALGRAPAWLPTVDCLAADGQRSLHMLEVPVSAYVSGGLWNLLGGSLDVWGRLTSIAFSTGSVALMFLLVRRWHGDVAAWAASITLALSPVGIVYGQSFMLEASVVFFSLLTVWCWELWLDERRWPCLAIAAVALALLLLTKIYMAVLLLPLAIRTLTRRTSEGSRLDGHPIPRWRVGLVFYTASGIATLVAALPAALWLWQVVEISSPGHPLSGRLYYSLRDSAEVHALPHPLLGSAKFYGGFLVDLATVALTPLGLLLAVVGIVHRGCRRQLPWLLAMLVLVLTLPLKFHKMNYYFLVILPPLCIMAGLGWQTIYERLKLSPRWAAVALALAATLSLRYAVRPAFITPEEDRDVLAAAQAVRELTAPEEPVVTMHGSTIDLLYYCDRPGWAVSPRTKDLSAVLADCQKQGAAYLVIAGGGTSCEVEELSSLAELAAVWSDATYRILRLTRSVASRGGTP